MGEGGRKEWERGERGRREGKKNKGRKTEKTIRVEGGRESAIEGSKRWIAETERARVGKQQ